VVLLRIKQVLFNGDELCRVYNPDYLGDDNERKRKIGLRKGRGPTHYTIDCHDFTEDDTICRGTL
jgi:hypothetical protein